MKKLFTIIFFSITYCIYSWAFVVDSILYNKIGTNEVEVAYNSGQKMPKNLVIPERVTYNGVTYVVRKIGYLAFQYRTFSSISIPNTVVAIGNNSFLECNVPQVIIPKSVKTIGSEAFAYCKATSYVFGDGVESIGNEAFNLYASNDLKTLSFPVSLKTIGKKCFCCEKMTSVSCAAVIPPTLADSTSFYFRTSSKNMVDTLFVPRESVEAYKQSPWAKKFKYILPHDFVEDTLSSVSDVIDGSVSLSFRIDTNVVQYNINLYQEGIPFAEYIVNNKGEVIYQGYLSLLLKARNKLQNVESLDRSLCVVRKIMTDTTTNSTEYFVITLNNLQPTTDYTYTIRGFDAAKVPIYNDMGEFCTDDVAIRDVYVDERKKYNATKFYYKGVIYIRYSNGDVYNMRGARVR